MVFDRAQTEASVATDDWISTACPPEEDTAFDNRIPFGGSSEDSTFRRVLDRERGVLDPEPPFSRGKSSR